ncbi:MAG TPA: ubiquitin-like domain-containing protein [Paenibacillus sp.]|nr:ubiquitin-like domain-containing protein [Paenibacillus sp.]HZG55817.1 ubiquitin-like domain-containing protein [Paenibacillus sp.]
MGQIPVQEAHEESLSDKSYAWRWARAHKKLLLSVVAATVAAVGLFSTMVYGTQMKRVAIIADGATIEVVTTASTVADVLKEQRVQVGTHDELSLSPTAELKHGAAIQIERAFPVRITSDGKTAEVYTTAAGVEDVLKKAGIQLGPLDKIEPALTQRLTASADVKIVRVQRVVEETEHALPFETVKQADKTLPKGKEKVVQEGQEGVLVKQIEKIYEDGVLVSEQVLARTVEQESLAKIVAVGTKVEPKPVSNAVAVLAAETQQITLDGMTFGVKGVLKNVTLTAYSADFASTGKNKGDKGYGITASGTTVQEGRTIAVDTSVIPMGWWVYIDGIGFRRAEDKGSAVKGKKIDVYFDSESYAQKFGTKKGYTVYVIGPKKPVTN